MPCAQKLPPPLLFSFSWHLSPLAQEHTTPGQGGPNQPVEGALGQDRRRDDGGEHRQVVHQAGDVRPEAGRGALAGRGEVSPPDGAPQRVAGRRLGGPRSREDLQRLRLLHVLLLLGPRRGPESRGRPRGPRTDLERPQRSRGLVQGRLAHVRRLAADLLPPPQRRCRRLGRRDLGRDRGLVRGASRATGRTGRSSWS